MLFFVPSLVRKTEFLLAMQFLSESDLGLCFAGRVSKFEYSELDTALQYYHSTSAQHSSNLAKSGLCVCVCVSKQGNFISSKQSKCGVKCFMYGNGTEKIDEVSWVSLVRSSGGFRIHYLWSRNY